MPVGIRILSVTSPFHARGKSVVSPWIARFMSVARPSGARVKSVICPLFSLSGRNERQRMESAQSAARRKLVAKPPSSCPDVDAPASTINRFPCFTL